MIELLLLILILTLIFYYHAWHHFKNNTIILTFTCTVYRLTENQLTIFIYTYTCTVFKIAIYRLTENELKAKHVKALEVIIAAVANCVDDEYKSIVTLDNLQVLVFCMHIYYNAILMYITTVTGAFYVYKHIYYTYYINSSFFIYGNCVDDEYRSIITLDNLQYYCFYIHNTVNALQMYINTGTAVLYPYIQYMQCKCILILVLLSLNAYILYMKY